MPHTVRDLKAIATDPGPQPQLRVSRMARELVGSEILKIAADIRAMAREGRQVCNLTVGDFDPRQFPIPARLTEAIVQALGRGETNYPPSNGVLELRQALQRLYRRELGLDYPIESFLVAGGARPVIYGTYRALCEPGDRVVYPVPSWNNNHYCHVVGAQDVVVECGADTRFMPTRDALLPHLPGARLLALNSPLNPAGTAITPEALRGICEAIVAENLGRESRGERPLWLMYDHVYWMLCLGQTRHVTPPELVPEVARWTIFVDGISKGFAATGLRVGWAVGPVDAIERLSALLGHVGAWAPRAEQVATVSWLDDAEGMAAFRGTFLEGLGTRLRLLHEGIQALRGRGLAVESIEPMGAIYLTVRIHPFGRRTPGGVVLRTNEDVRRYLLEEAAIGIVPFQAFGMRQDTGWFRLSVGAVSVDEIRQALPRLERALTALR